MIPETGQTNPDAFEVEVAEHGRRLASEAVPVASVEERTEEPDRLLSNLRAFLMYLTGPTTVLLADDRARARRLLDSMPLVALAAKPEQSGGAAPLRADVVTSVLDEVLKLRELVALYMPQFGDVRQDTFARLTRIEQLVRGERL